ncbi:hypothetical protein [Natronococcus wangiae]|uniref:hypothetical protein n=1 Tax=Natronococcus wangiae TaxID=3068275 RepID=UPI00387EBD38
MPQSTSHHRLAAPSGRAASRLIRNSPLVDVLYYPNMLLDKQPGKRSLASFRPLNFYPTILLINGLSELPSSAWSHLLRDRWKLPRRAAARCRPRFEQFLESTVMQPQEPLTITLDFDPLQRWTEESTASTLRALAVRLHSSGLSLRETAAALEQFGVNRSHQAVFQWVHCVAEEAPEPQLLNDHDNFGKWDERNIS